MRLLVCAGLFFISIILCLAQTPVADGPLGKMNPYPDSPGVYPGSYDPPPMELIPAGKFEMGDHYDVGWPNELPVHLVNIDSFYMDTFEVTNNEYCAFLNSAYKQGLIEVTHGMVKKRNDTEIYCHTAFYTPYSRITWNGSTFRVLEGKEDHPMAVVSWCGAVAYANWRSTQELRFPCYNLETWECTFGVGGYRLPTEAEWEMAARGGEHDPYYKYPWGNTIEGSKANYFNSGDPFETGDYPWTTPIGYYDGNQIPSDVDMANRYGLYDMAGNVFEWCNDWFDGDYYSYSPYDNPKGPSSGNNRVFRGGSWWTFDNSVRCATRGYYTAYIPYEFAGLRLVLENP